MKNIKFNKGRYIDVFRLEMFDHIEENGQITIVEKPIKEIYPACRFFDFEPEVGDVYIIDVGWLMSHYYWVDSPKGWPGKYSSIKLDPGLYHARITHIHNGFIFYVIEEKENSYESVLDIRNEWPGDMYFDVKDLPKDDKIKYLDIYDTQH